MKRIGSNNDGARLVLVRHGETEWTERRLLHGRLDSPLSTRGAHQAALVGRRLRAEAEQQPFDALYCSPLGRARQTAEIIGLAVGMEPRPLDGLREADFGWVEGWPLRLVDPAQGPRWLRPVIAAARALSAERPGPLARRVRGAVETMLAEHPHGRLIVVTHWGTISMLLASLVDGDPAAWPGRGPWAACGLSELQAMDGRWSIQALNDCAHLMEGSSS